jgi:hypothetical protein
VLVPGKLFQPILTNTTLVGKLVKYGQKKFYNIGPGLSQKRYEKHSSFLQELE